MAIGQKSSSARTIGIVLSICLFLAKLFAINSSNMSCNSRNSYSPQEVAENMPDTTGNYTAAKPQTLTQFKFENIGWKINIPYGFIINSDSSNFFEMEKNSLNFFACTISPHKKSDASWQKEIKDYKAETLGMFATEGMSTAVDTATKAKISNIQFDLWRIKVIKQSINNTEIVVLYKDFYYKVFKKQDVKISISYSSEDVGDELNDMMKKSIFDVSE